MTSGELILAVGMARVAWEGLDDLLEPTRQSPPDEVDPATRRARLVRQARLAREDRVFAVAVTKAGAVPTGAVPAPLNTYIASERTALERVVCAAGVDAYRARAGQPLASVAADVRTRMPVALDVLSATARRLVPEHAAAMADPLRRAADRAYRVVGLGPAWVPLGLDCPACDGPGLRGRIDSPVDREWVVECADPSCCCRGGGCDCSMPGRLVGRRHVWAWPSWLIVVSEPGSILVG